MGFYQLRHLSNIVEMILTDRFSFPILWGFFVDIYIVEDWRIWSKSAIWDKDYTGFFFVSPSFFTSVSCCLLSFWISVAGGRFSGVIPLFIRNSLTHWLFLECSDVIAFSPFIFLFSRILWLVTSAARSFALRRTVGRKSARERSSWIPSFSFIALVLLPPKSIVSHLLLIRAIPIPSTHLSNVSPVNCFSVWVNFSLTWIRS